MWSNKGYDIIFKQCECDCGHGKLKKDLDFVPPVEEPLGAVALDPENVAPPDKKKKKKEKANLKPKLNFNAQNVTGSYYGSNRQKEEEEVENNVRSSTTRRQR